MEFSYRRYLQLVNTIREAGYTVCKYTEWEQYNRPCILRHDIDFSLKRALDMAIFEHENDIKSTFFVLLTTDMYNPLSKNGESIIRKIHDMGHDIGLHYDESRYGVTEQTENEYIEQIYHEKNILESICGDEVKVISMHCPSKKFLSSDIFIPGMINSYSKLFFKEFKYCSDSMRVWHEDIEQGLAVESYRRLHILTHAFWWREIEEDRDVTIRSWIRDNINETFEFIHQWYPDA